MPIVIKDGKWPQKSKPKSKDRLKGCGSGTVYLLFVACCVAFAHAAPASVKTMTLVRHWCAARHLTMSRDLRDPRQLTFPDKWCPGLEAFPSSGMEKPKPGDLYVWPNHAAEVISVRKSTAPGDISQYERDMIAEGVVVPLHYAAICRDYGTKRPYRLPLNYEAREETGIWSTRVKPYGTAAQPVCFLRPACGPAKVVHYVVAEARLGEYYGRREIKAVVSYVRAIKPGELAYIGAYTSNYMDERVPWTRKINSIDVARKLVSLKARETVPGDVTYAFNVGWMYREEMSSRIKLVFVLFSSGSFSNTSNIRYLRESIGRFTSVAGSVKVYVVPVGGNWNREVLADIVELTHGQLLAPNSTDIASLLTPK